MYRWLWPKFNHICEGSAQIKISLVKFWLRRFNFEVFSLKFGPNRKLLFYLSVKLNVICLIIIGDARSQVQRRIIAKKFIHHHHHHNSPPLLLLSLFMIVWYFKGFFHCVFNFLSISWPKNVWRWVGFEKIFVTLY